MSKKDIFIKKNITSDGKNAIFYGDISRKYDCFAQEIINRIDDESYQKATKIEKGQILVNLEDFSHEDIGRCVLYQNDNPAAINGNVLLLTLKDSFKDIIDLRYIAFLINYKDTIRKYIYQKSAGEKVKRLKKIDFENILIIVPILEVQNKTVNNFIELKRQFEDDVAEIERKIKLIDGYSKVYFERVLNFKNKELSSEQRRNM